MVNAFEKDLDLFRDSMPLIEYMTKEAMKVKGGTNKKEIKYWKEVFQECVEEDLWVKEVAN